MILTLLSLMACDKGASPVDSEAAASAATWHGEVRPLLEQHCNRCHEAGGLGVGDFTEQAQAEAFAERILARAEEGTMPPAVSDPECHDFLGAEQATLDDEELARLRSWVQGGLPEGDPADYVAPVIVEPSLPDADLELLMPAAYTPSYADAANPGNEYRCFVLDPGRAEDFFITAMHPIIDHAAIAHHAVLFTAQRDAVAGVYDGPQGFDCIDGEGPSDDIIAAWAPGMMPVAFTEGYGLKVRAEQVLVLQMHYFRSGAAAEGEPDRSGYAIRTAPTVSREVFLAPLGIFDFAIPAGEAAWTDSDSLENTFIDLKVHGVFPHMHRLGTDYSMSIVDEDGAEQCVVAGRYDFDNQLFYMFEEPIDFPEGATARYSCTWDNSEGNPERVTEEPVTTRYGERTDEEMCYFFTFISAG